MHPQDPTQQELTKGGVYQEDSIPTKEVKILETHERNRREIG
jgi:hypothetical protein